MVEVVLEGGVQQRRRAMPLLGAVLTELNYRLVETITEAIIDPASHRPLPGRRRSGLSHFSLH
jgi:hypothetical protein